jgi:hypothetical protein
MSGERFGETARTTTEVKNSFQIETIEVRFERMHPEIEELWAMVTTAVVIRWDISKGRNPCERTIPEDGRRFLLRFGKAVGARLGA